MSVQIVVQWFMNTVSTGVQGPNRVWYIAIIICEGSTIDDLDEFLPHKISLLNSDGSSVSKVDQVFETALFELHNSLVLNYFLTLQVCVYFV